MRVKKRLFIAVFLLALTPFPLWRRRSKRPHRHPRRKPRSRRPPNRTTGSDPGTSSASRCGKTGPGPSGDRAAGRESRLSHGRGSRGSGKDGRPAPEGDRGKLSLFVKDAVITVEVRQVNSHQIYVLGASRRPAGRS